MPAKPPLTLRNTASARNCSRTCSRRAPIAIRSPISRVRSVTETSRMFMIPMPPTSSKIDATAASKSVMMRLLLSAVSTNWLRILGGFVFSAAVAIFFGYYPARKAAHLDPIDALRYE
jgi:hypothetical protein